MVVLLNRPRSSFPSCRSSPLCELPSSISPLMQYHPREVWREQIFQTPPQSKEVTSGLLVWACSLQIRQTRSNHLWRDTHPLQKRTGSSAKWPATTWKMPEGFTLLTILVKAPKLNLNLASSVKRWTEWCFAIVSKIVLASTEWFLLQNTVE